MSSETTAGGRPRLERVEYTTVAGQVRDQMMDWIRAGHFESHGNAHSDGRPAGATRIALRGPGELVAGELVGGGYRVELTIPLTRAEMDER